ncbi:hypothetical protein FQB35_09195 [Crassaminicella thermophila]|uniref:DUF6385 domain-containing protein n=1 Tax=Crassaminicella thermophila TaxID=2599308 RepID=A0A5C0SHQ4_CRATE|nr:DUF6385 domain-containing protein [Crassaminicella thermophila]QEK12489.1 hypothetical protein FQB35_09195 [Crassaminicella thermophila]
MPNNIVFNNVADQLKTKIYGDDSGTTRAIALDASGKILIGSLDTINTINYIATVDTVNNVSSVDLVDTVATVNEVTNVSSVDLVDTVATVNYVADVQKITDTVDVKIVSNDFTESSSVVVLGADASTTVLSIDTSEKNMYSYYIASSGAATVNIQISPTTADSYFINDATSAVMTANSTVVLVPEKFLKYTRLYLQAGSGGATASVYFNAHN